MKGPSVIRAPLDENVISNALQSNYWRVRLLPEVSSTQDILKDKLVSNGDCVVTEYQSAGRGRLDRSFVSPSHAALLFSFFITPKRPEDMWGAVPLLAGMTVAQTLNEISSSENFSTKWPNDVIATTGKVAGILCERYSTGIIVGIGINVSTLQEELPVPTATSLYLSTGVEFDRNVLLAALLNNFAEIFGEWDTGADFRESYRQTSETLGRRVEVQLPHAAGDQAAASGVATDVDSDGALILDGGRRITVGDIIHLR